jgi:hypothetical protein
MPHQCRRMSVRAGKFEKEPGIGFLLPLSKFGRSQHDPARGLVAMRGGLAEHQGRGRGGWAVTD